MKGFPYKIGYAIGLAIGFVIRPIKKLLNITSPSGG